MNFKIPAAIALSSMLATSPVFASSLYVLAVIGGQAPKSNVRAGQNVFQGEQVRTGKATNMFGIFTHMGVKIQQIPNSVMTLDLLGETKNGARQLNLSLSTGMIKIVVPKLTNRYSIVTIETPEGITRITGTDLAVTKLEDRTRVGVDRGTVEAVAKGQTISVGTGQYTEAKKGSLFSPPKKADTELKLFVVPIPVSYSRDPLFFQKKTVTLTVKEGNVILTPTGKILGETTEGEAGDVFDVANPFGEVKRWKVVTSLPQQR